MSIKIANYAELVDYDPEFFANVDGVFLGMIVSAQAPKIVTP